MKLTSNGILYKSYYNSTTKKEEYENVTNKAYLYLRDEVTLEGVSVRDIYSLISKNEILQKILYNDFIDDFLQYIKEGHKPNPLRDMKGSIPIEKVEIYNVGYYCPELNRLEVSKIPHVHGLTKILTQECEGFPAGSAIEYSLSFVPLEELLDLEVVTNPIVKCDISNICHHYDFSTKFSFENRNYSLFEVINAITNELSFHGNPLQSAETSEKLAEIVEEFHNNPNFKTHSQEDIEDFFGDKPLLKGFSFIDDSIDKKSLNTFMSFLPNSIDICEFFHTLLKDKVVIDQSVMGYNAYEYRHKMHGSPKDMAVSSEMKNIIAKKESLRSNIPVKYEKALFTYAKKLGINLNTKTLKKFM